MSIDNYTQEEDALQARFIAIWADRTPVQYPNMFYDPTGVDWARFSVIGADGAAQMSMGAGLNLFRNVGMVAVQIYTVLGKGTKRATELADAVVDGFLGYRVNGLTFLQPPYAKSVGASGGNMWQTNVFAPYQRDSFR